jgi:hypothetical protein
MKNTLKKTIKNIIIEYFDKHCKKLDEDYWDYSEWEDLLDFKKFVDTVPNIVLEANKRRTIFTIKFVENGERVKFSLREYNKLISDLSV